MDDEKRRELRRPIERAINNDTIAFAAIEEMVVDFDRKGAASDAAAAMELVARMAPEVVHQEIVLRLQGRGYNPMTWQYGY
jgi:hypothetical protein